ncbi:hypothetical protein MMC25_000549 [Agyrium rufum]|nr:hypothetical protein [Agyrium rufum]
MRLYEHVTLIAISSASLWVPTLGGSQAKWSKNQKPTTIVSTCASQSINYVTQTLPQQCLRTDWPRQNASNASSQSRAEGTSDSYDTTALVVSHTAVQSVFASRELSPLSSEITRQSTILSATPNVTLQENPTNAASSSSTSSVAETPKPSAEADLDSESDPFSDNANFLSFEEWKNQMLKRAGQSPDHVGKGSQAKAGDQRRRPADINALDALGEDSEIELDFSGFVSPEDTLEAIASKKLDGSNGKEHRTSGQAVSGEGTEGSAKISARSKDAGKTCKERFNYASFDCAATVLKTNPESKGSTSVLLENKDSYMLNHCSAKNKFLIVELCNDILIDTVVLANYEFFSSTFRTFRISVSPSYPVKIDKWKELGVFEARNTRDIQPFLVESQVWARYLRIEFLTHYGMEYYCPVSLLRVHGRNMMDDYRNELKAARGEDDVGENVSEMEDNEMEKQQSNVIFADVLKDDGKEKVVLGPDLQATTSSAAAGHTLPTQGSNLNSTELSDWITFASPLLEYANLVSGSCGNHAPLCPVEHCDAIEKVNARIRRTLQIDTQPQEAANSRSEVTNVQPMERASSPTPITPNKPKLQTDKAPSTSQSSVNISTYTPRPGITNNTSSNYAKPSSSTPPIATPTTQESFFKSIAKRLSYLEANSTLSLQYIEEQSRILRDAFTKVEKRQLSKTSSFLEMLNTTVLNELRDFRTQYDQIWQSTVLELASQRQASQQEVIALSARLSILAEEMVWQQRMVTLLFSLIALCLGLLIFSHLVNNGNGGSVSLEVQTALNAMIKKPSKRFSRYLNPDTSPPGSPATRPGSRGGLLWARSVIGGEGDLERTSRSADLHGCRTNHTSHLRSPSNDLLFTLADEIPKSPDTDVLEFPSPTMETQNSNAFDRDADGNVEPDDPDETIISDISKSGRPDSIEVPAPLPRSHSSPTISNRFTDNEDDESRESATEMREETSKEGVTIDLRSHAV